MVLFSLYGVRLYPFRGSLESENSFNSSTCGMKLLPYVGAVKIQFAKVKKFGVRPDHFFAESPRELDV
jgi:hypothetical protein